MVFNLIYLQVSTEIYNNYFALRKTNPAVVLQPLSWSLLSNRTSPVAQYRVYCSAAYVIPEHIVWRKNGTVVMNSSSTTMSHQLVDAATDNYTNILTVTGDHHTQSISCGAELI